MGELTELLKAIASLLWPSLGFVALFIFKDELAEAIGRIKKGKFLGQEIELREELSILHETAKEASEEVAAIPKKTESSEESITTSSHSDNEIFESIIKLSAQSPKAALLLLTSEVEREARETLASTGKLEGQGRLTLFQTLDLLDSHYGLPRHVSGSVRLFWDTRNRLIHGAGADDNNILSAIDSGVTILKALQAMPREKNWVHHEGVRIFSDPDCVNEYPEGKGIILRTESSSGTQTTFRIYPSTKTHFTKGSRVAWEWSFGKTWNEAWYRDPEAGEIKPAWKSSAEFIGRNLEDL